MEVNKLKEEIMKHYWDSIDFVDSLMDISEKEWRTPIKDGKWSVAEIIGHFKAWDDFVMENRLPYLFSGKELSKGPDSERVNSESAVVSREESQNVTIEKFISTRKEFNNAIQKIPDKDWDKTFTIGTTTLTLHEYLNGLIQHDLHHFEQIKSSFKK